MEVQIYLGGRKINNQQHISRIYQNKCGQLTMNAMDFSTKRYIVRENWNHTIIISQNYRYVILIHMSLTHVGPTCHWLMDGISPTFKKIGDMSSYLHDVVLYYVNLIRCKSCLTSPAWASLSSPAEPSKIRSLVKANRSSPSQALRTSLQSTNQTTENLLG